MTNGALAGFPVVDIKATLYDGSYHDVDSSVLAFQVLASVDWHRRGYRVQEIFDLPPNVHRSLLTLQSSRRQCTVRAGVAALSGLPRLVALGNM